VHQSIERERERERMATNSSSATATTAAASGADPEMRIVLVHETIGSVLLEQPESPLLPFLEAPDLVQLFQSPTNPESVRQAALARLVRLIDGDDDASSSTVDLEPLLDVTPLRERVLVRLLEDRTKRRSSPQKRQAVSQWLEQSADFSAVVPFVRSEGGYKHHTTETEDNIMDISELSVWERLSRADSRWA